MHGWQSWLPNVAVVAASAVSAVAIVRAAARAAEATRDTAQRNFDARMVEIGVSILAADPGKSDVTPARQWAIDLVSNHSGQPFTPEDVEKLLHNRLSLSGAVLAGANVTGGLTVTPPN